MECQQSAGGQEQHWTLQGLEHREGVKASRTGVRRRCRSGVTCLSEHDIGQASVSKRCRCIMCFNARHGLRARSPKGPCVNQQRRSCYRQLCIITLPQQPVSSAVDIRRDAAMLLFSGRLVPSLSFRGERAIGFFATNFRDEHARGEEELGAAGEERAAKRGQGKVDCLAPTLDTLSRW